MNDPLRQVEREIREWTARVPTRSPRAARTRVLARIPDRRRFPRWGIRGSSGWALATIATALIAVLGAGLLLRGPEAPNDPPVTVAATPAATPPSPGLLVYQLESGTKLYLALATTTIQATPTPAGNSTLEGNG